MLDIILILTLLGSVIVVVLIGLIVYRGRKTSLTDEKKKKGISHRSLQSRLNNEDVSNQSLKNRKQRASRLHRERMRENRKLENEEKNEYDDSYDDDDDSELIKDNFLSDVKIGVKKRRKLEAKAEKKAAREKEIEEREERKQRLELLEEKRRKEDAKREQEEKEKEEEEKRLKEEKERKEHEEYIKMKEEFEVQEEGFDEDGNVDESEKKLQVFINYIESKKVVLLEDLAGHFKMKTQDVINRLQNLLETEQITGVIDDRGKFISITTEELKQVAKFIQKRGRVSIVELVENSNKLLLL